MAVGWQSETATVNAHTSGTGLVFVPILDWAAAIGLDTLQAAIIVTAMYTASGNTKAQLAVQTASVRTDNPDAWAVVSVTGGGLSVVGQNHGASASLDVSGLTAAKAWVRWGVAFSMDSGGTAPGSADVTLTVAGVVLGEMIGGWRGQLTSSVTSDANIAITGWVPAIWAQKVMAALLVTSADANFRCRLRYRTAESSQSAPGSWTNTGDSNQSGNQERVAVDNALSLGSNLWVQFGLAYSSSSGTSSADVMVSVGVRRS